MREKYTAVFLLKKKKQPAVRNEPRLSVTHPEWRERLHFPSSEELVQFPVQY